MLHNITTSRAIIINQLFRFLSGLLFQVFLTHSALNASQVGVFETIIFAWVSISFFWVNAFVNVAVVFLNDDLYEKYISEVFLARQFLLASVLNFFLAAIFAYFFSPQIFNTAPFTFIFWGAQVFLNATNFIEPKLISENNPQKILEFGVFNLLTPYILLGALIFLGINSFYAVIIFLAYCSLVSFIYLSRYINFKITNFALQKIKTDFIKSVSPLIGYAAANNLTTVFTQSLVLGFYKTHPDKFATFRYGVRELPFTIAITNGFGLSAMASLNTEQGLIDFRENSKKIMYQIYGLSWVLLLTSQWFIPIIFSEKFNGVIGFFNLNVLLVLSRALMPQVILRAKNAQLPILYAGIMETVFIIILSWLLLQKFGAMGVLFAVVLGFLAEKIILAFILKTKYNIRLKDYTPVNTYLLCSFFTLFLYFLVTR